MKRYLFLCLLINLAFVQYAYSFDLKGLQPLAPYGVFSTFSADSLKAATAGISLGIEKSTHPDFYRITNQFAFGITDKIELELTSPYIVSWKGSTNGFEDVAIGLKHRVLDESKFAPALAYIITASLPYGRDEFSTEGSWGGGIILSKRVGPVAGHVNLLYSRPGTGSFRDDITFATGIDFNAANNFKFLAELYGKKSYAGKVDRLELRFGYRVQAAENLFTTLGAGFDIKNRTPEYRLMLSLSYIFPKEKKTIKKIIEEEE